MGNVLENFNYEAQNERERRIIERMRNRNSSQVVQRRIPDTFHDIIEWCEEGNDLIALVRFEGEEDDDGGNGDGDGDGNDYNFEEDFNEFVCNNKDVQLRFVPIVHRELLEDPESEVEIQESNANDDLLPKVYSDELIDLNSLPALSKLTMVHGQKVLILLEAMRHIPEHSSEPEHDQIEIEHDQIEIEHDEPDVQHDELVEHDDPAQDNELVGPNDEESIEEKLVEKDGIGLPPLEEKMEDDELAAPFETHFHRKYITVWEFSTLLSLLRGLNRLLITGYKFPSSSPSSTDTTVDTNNTDFTAPKQEEGDDNNNDPGSAENETSNNDAKISMKSIQEHDQEECSVCMDLNVQTVLPCSHGFCFNCTDQWVECKENCPVCRNVVTKRILKKEPWQLETWSQSDSTEEIRAMENEILSFWSGVNCKKPSLLMDQEFLQDFMEILPSPYDEDEVDEDDGLVVGYETKSDGEEGDSWQVVTTIKQKLDGTEEAG